MTMFLKFSVLVLAASLISNASLASGSESNVEFCKHFYEQVVNQGKVEEIDEVFSADFVEHEPFPGLEANREGAKQFFAMMHTAFPDLEFDVDFYMSDGSKVAAYVTIRGTHQGEFMGIEPTGRKINVRVIDIMRIEDGKFVEHWGVTDGLAMMEQLGVME